MDGWMDVDIENKAKHCLQTGRYCIYRDTGWMVGCIDTVQKEILYRQVDRYCIDIDIWIDKCVDTVQIEKLYRQMDRSILYKYYKDIDGYCINTIGRYILYRDTIQIDRQIDTVHKERC